MDKYRVSGMTCAACAANVERAVKKLGAGEATVSLLSGTMTVEGGISSQAVCRAVEAAGYGCTPFDGGPDKAQPQKEEGAALKGRLRASVLFLLLLMYLTMGHMVGLPLPGFLYGKENQPVYAFTQLLLALPVAFINRSFFINGLKALWHKSPNMDSLIALGSGAAYVYGIAAIYAMGWGLGHGDAEMVQRFAGQLYFESGAMILTLVTLGRFLEARSKGRTGDAIRALRELTPRTALLEREKGVEEVALEQVRPGDIVRVQPGSGIPVDGTLIAGVGAVDESAMTGESMPVEVQPGSFLRAGTINGNGALRIRVERVGEETTLSQIVRLVEEAGATKAPIARLADKIAGVFVPAVMGIALLTLVGWLMAGKPLAFALNNTIAVLVISCPCALGLATPVAVMVGTGKAASLGVLFKNAAALERTREVQTVVLDKTGTLTEGMPKVTDVIELAPGLEELAAALEAPSGHPLSQAVGCHAKEKGVEIREVADFEAVPGRGVKGALEGEICLGGNPAMMAEAGIDISMLSQRGQELESEGKTCMYFARAGKAVGLIAAADQPKPDSARAVEKLQKMGLKVVMLTGDRERTARAVAKELGIRQVVAGVLPQDKEGEIRRLQQAGGMVAMVGDGINDAPALVRADIGIAIGAGSDIAVESADVVLMKSGLTGVVNAIRLSKRVVAIIRQNLFWAFFYNAALIPLAAGLFYEPLGWQISPMLGAAAMSVSSLTVVSNALRIYRFRGEGTTTGPVPENKNEERNMTKVLKIEGMMCGHCKMRVEKVLLEVHGVTACEADPEGKRAVVTCARETTDEALCDAVHSAGYEVLSVD